MGRFNNPSEEFSSANTPDKEIIPLSEGLGQSNPRLIFFTLLSNFKNNPDKNNHEKILEHLKTYPMLFTEKLDVPFEAAIYSWRDLLIQRNVETVDLLFNLMNQLKGDNQLMIKRFSTILFDSDIKTFLKTYIRSKDLGCNFAIEIADNISEEEKYNELIERADNLDAYLASDQVDPSTKQFATNCQTTLKVHLEKLKLVYGNLPQENAISNEETEQTSTPSTTTEPPTGESAP